MKVTRFTQSCLLIEEADARILIDVSADEADDLDKFSEVEAVLYTHEHGDHFAPEVAKHYIDKKVPVYVNDSTAGFFPELE